MKTHPAAVRSRHVSCIGVLLTLGLLLAVPRLDAATEVYGYFRHSSADLFINIGNSYQSAASGPVLDEQLPMPPPPADPPSLYGKYQVDFGEISVFAANDGTAALPTAGVIFTNAGTTAGFTDSFTLNAPGVPFYSSGTMVVRIDITGSLAATGRASAGYILDIGVGPSCCAQLFGTRYGPDFNIGGGNIVGNDFGSYLILVPVTFGLTSNLGMRGNVDASDYEGPGSATADLYSTFSWGGVQALYDANDNLVENFQLVSESGYDYATLKPQVVPLPPSAWLLLTGVAGIVVRRLRKRPPTREA